MWLVNIMPLILQAFAGMVINPIFWIVIILVVMQYRRIVFPPEQWDSANVDINSGSLLKKLYSKIARRGK